MTELLAGSRLSGNSFEQLHPRTDMQDGLLYDDWLDAAHAIVISKYARTMPRQERQRFWAPEGYMPRDCQDPLGVLEGLYTLQQSTEDPKQFVQLARQIAEDLTVRFAAQTDYMLEDWENGYLPRFGTFWLRSSRSYVIYNYAPRARFTGRILSVAGEVVEGTTHSTPGFVPEIDMSPRVDLHTGEFLPYKPGKKVVALPHPGQSPLLVEQHMVALYESVNHKLLRPTVAT